MRRLLLAAICAALAVAACGGDSATSSGGAGTSAPTTSGGGGSGDTLTVSGSLSLTLHETSGSSNMCTTNANGGASAIIGFDAYDLQFFLPAGTTTFPAPAGANAGVAFYNANDSSQEWAIVGSTTGTGTASLSSDRKHGTVDVDLLPHPPHPNPSLQPIHVKGSFSCP